MKFVQFEAVEIQVDEDKGTANVRIFEIDVNPDMVCAILPAVIPGEIAGPGGRPTPKMAARLVFGATSITVKSTRDEAKDRLVNGMSCEPAKPATKVMVPENGKGPNIISIHT